MNYPVVKIDLAKLKANTEQVAKLCRERGVALTGVTKAVCADIRVARTMLNGGASMLGDSRLQNLRKLRGAGIDAPLMMLRLPMLSEAAEIVKTADISLVSELATAAALSRAAVQTHTRHRLVLMVDMGDRREGIMPQKILHQAEEILRLPAVELAGLGTNLACLGGVIPTPEIFTEMLELAADIRSRLGVPLPVISGGNSATFDLLTSGNMPEGITNLRVGEGILLGRETVNRSPLPGCHLDAITLYGEIIELQEKPSQPRGLIGLDAFGRRPVFADRGIRRRAIVAIGRQDTSPEGLSPLLPGLEVLGASSDHLLVDVNDSPVSLSVGDELGFTMDYASLIPAMTSPYVAKTHTSR